MKLFQIKEYIQRNYMLDISLKELADLTYVSRSYFSTAFKNADRKELQSISDGNSNGGKL